MEFSGKNKLLLFGGKTANPLSEERGENE